MTYDERLHAPWTWWLGGLLIVAVFAAAVMAYFPPAVSVFVVLAMAAVVAVLLGLYGNVRIHVADGRLRVGQFEVEHQWLSHAEAFTGDDARRILGVDADMTDHLVTRPYIHDVVRVTIDDPADPHGHWIVSSRRPDDLARAVNTLGADAPEERA